MWISRDEKTFNLDKVNMISKRGDSQIELEFTEDNSETLTYKNKSERDTAYNKIKNLLSTNGGLTEV